MTTPHTTDGDVVLAAQRFAEVLRRTAEWEEWVASETSLANAHDVGALNARIAELSEAWQRTRAAGDASPVGGELATAQRTLRAHPAILRQHQATEELVALLRRANGYLSADLELDFAETAARAGGACCAS